MHTAANLGLVCLCLWILAAAGCGGGSSAAPITTLYQSQLPLPVAGISTSVSPTSIQLAWLGQSGVTHYQVLRSTSINGPFTQIGTPQQTQFTDTGSVPGRLYFYQVAAVNQYGAGPASSAAAAAWSSQSVQISVNAWADRHFISPYIYGLNLSNFPGEISASHATWVRWGDEFSSTYDWQNCGFNAGYYSYFFVDSIYQPAGAPACGATTTAANASSVNFVRARAAAGYAPLMTIPMLGWTAKGGSQYYSYSVAKYGAQCSTSVLDPDIGDGIKPDCQTFITRNDPHDAYVPLLDAPAAGDPAGAVYRQPWVQALAAAFGAAPHFYALDNEPDVWNLEQRDIHPGTVTYDELAGDFSRESALLRQWDPQAFVLGPVSCCWKTYWNSTAGAADKTAHGNQDFWPWWLNDVLWRGQAGGTQLVDDFDFHAFPEVNPLNGAFVSLGKRIFAAVRSWSDPAFVDADSWIAGQNVTSMQPLPHAQAPLIRALAMVNGMAPGLPVSVSEWDFSQSRIPLLQGGLSFSGLGSPLTQALSQLQGWGLLGQYDLFAAAGYDDFVGTLPPEDLFTNYDSRQDGFDPVSIQTTNTCPLDSTGTFTNCAAFASLSRDGSQMTLLILNLSPFKVLQAGLNLNHFSPTSSTSYTYSAGSQMFDNRPPAAIAPGAGQPWSGNVTVDPDSAVLLVIQGQAGATTADWALNPPDAAAAALLPGPAYFPPGIIMIAAGASVNLHPVVTTGAGTVTLTGITTDAGITGAILQPAVMPAENAVVTLTAPAGTAPGFYNFTVQGKDNGGAVQTESGILEVGNPAATLAASGDAQSAAPGATVNFGVTVVPGASQASANGQEILYTASAGTLAAAPGGHGGGAVGEWRNPAGGNRRRWRGAGQPDLAGFAGGRDHHGGRPLCDRPSGSHFPRNRAVNGRGAWAVNRGACF